MTDCVLGRILEAKAQATPHHPFLACHGRSDTYAELNARANQLAPRYALAGDPAQCRARLAQYIDAGAERLVLAPAWSARADSDRSVVLMAQSVMPAFR